MGSSVGISTAKNTEELKLAVREAIKYDAGWFWRKVWTAGS